MLINCFGEDGCGNRIKEGDPIGVIQSLWNRGDNPCRSAFHLLNTGKETLWPQVNQMFRWRVKMMKRQLEQFESMLETGSLTPIRYKTDWLGGLSDDYVDFDQENELNMTKEIVALLDRYIGKEIDEDGPDFKEFSEKFFELFKQKYPDHLAINRGKGRGYWNYNALGRRFEE